MNWKNSFGLQTFRVMNRSSTVYHIIHYKDAKFGRILHFMFGLSFHLLSPYLIWWWRKFWFAESLTKAEFCECNSICSHVFNNLNSFLEPYPYKIFLYNTIFNAWRVNGAYHFKERDKTLFISLSCTCQPISFVCVCVCDFSNYNDLNKDILNVWKDLAKKVITEAVTIGALWRSTKGAWKKILQILNCNWEMELSSSEQRDYFGMYWIQSIGKKKKWSV